ncbi:pheST operon leader peptide PheM [Brenneria goodwinii]|uniref:pheST attenuator peptide n=6 Tax=Pectobacteriaceae TaxID=1903410 RepID=A0A4P8QSY3_9GAMM|nr:MULTISPECIES: pheST operon leader peptide PheM [Enterobacterales]MCG8709962.1 pheST operon leader peptide PheM [Brenneria bubanii]MEE3641903.1 pheST operon leader peptide PheM [Brenneria sp. L3_3C_1]MEE3649400.1 pheST operon leader peptide PheM [Brenneria sp. HEZEL_4_2_4]MEE3661435.1 pheST operon leader peptide PheM [Brenneria sp. g21c3]HEI8865243.1 pheST operon leader peptide PheM [Serratia odorifera]
MHTAIFRFFFYFSA